ncbi:glycosyltransferase family 4 protein [Microbacterium radiodurans]|uniref:glycosyltransferase family 4 protein n=1 Tax=Microbacterium radiodurans TaxID=661398 RepID=UPI00168AEE60|nr:glycosyltransferase family 4 protein [Microbacterium radiodurans]
MLHVTDRYGGGVAAALHTYLENSPVGIEHHLLAATPDGTGVAAGTRSGFASSRPLPGAWVAQALALHSAVRELRPDVVHAHSSMSGVLVRIALRGTRQRIVYSPHCYAFERTDTRLRPLYRLAERMLLTRSGVTATCSEWESRLAVEALGAHPDRVRHVPNVAGAGFRDADDALAPAGSVMSVLGIGRLTAQKDPLRFLDAVERLRGAGVDVDPVWVGGGDAALAATLTAAGVTVVPWADHVAVRARLRAAHVYLHCAAWEGFPLALLEAASVGVPVLARQIGPLGELPDATRLDRGLGGLIRSWHSGAFDVWRAANQLEWRTRLAAHTAPAQTTALRALYEGEPSDA